LKPCHPTDDRVATALLLAAGTGNRLYPLTQDAPKCLTMVNGTSILERLISNLRRNGFKRLVVVTGYLEKQIQDFLGARVGGIEINYVFSPLYKTTNNIYSLWMAREIINEPFLLLESDIVFDESLLDSMRYPDRIATAIMAPELNGTCVTINESQRVKAFWAGNADSFGERRYKTVNIYSISLKSWREIVNRLDKRIADGKVNDYYEVVLAEMVADGSLSFGNVSFDNKPWYEIDTIEDLVEAEKLFLADDYTASETATVSHLEFPNLEFINAVAPSRDTVDILNDAK
jgi:choline kinase